MRFGCLPAFTPRTNPYQYDGITGPIMWNVDATVSKVFPIRERYKLEFRLEAYNVTNSLMWANPNLTVGKLSVRPVYSAGPGQSRPRDSVHAAAAVLIREPERRGGTRVHYRAATGASSRNRERTSRQQRLDGIGEVLFRDVMIASLDAE